MADITYFRGGIGIQTSDGTLREIIDNNGNIQAAVDLNQIEDANGNEILEFDTVASAVNYVRVANAATGSGPTISAQGDDTNIGLSIDAKGSGTITLGGTSTGNIVVSRTLASSQDITSSSATAGIGYATGAGGTVTQITSRTTGVTLNKITGQITLVSAAGSATPATFTVTNSAIAATDAVIAWQVSGTDLYHVLVTAVGAGSFNLTLFTTGGTTTEQPVIGFAVLKGVTA